MAVACGSCGAENPERAKYCLECGANLAVTSPATETRKTVTVIFCDVTGSTALGERLDAEAMRSVMARYFAAMSGVVESHGGTVEKFVGDAVMAVFGVPVLHEDDAVRALRAAAGMQDALEDVNDGLEADHGVRLAARIGVNSGEVVVGTDGSKGTVATGDAVNVAARLEQAAAPGEVLVGQQTWELARHAARAERVAPLTLKGKAADVPAWRLLDVEDLSESERVPTTSRLVGREREVALLEHAVERSRADRRCQLVTVLGAAGVGKTRLLAEALAELDPGTTVLSGRCLSYGEDIVFWPLQQMLRQAAGLEPGADDAHGRSRLRSLVHDDPEAQRIVERLAPLAGLQGTPAEADETHWAVRRLVEALGRRGPVVLVLDDVHWAEPALLDVVEHLAEWSLDTPLLLAALARPEFLDDRPQWGGGKLNASTVLLEPLPDDAAAVLLDNLEGALPHGARLDAGTRARILQAAGGMPLYIEQMLAMLADDGWPGPDDGDVHRRPVEVPPTVAALLAARLDRLPEDERTALEAASVVGLTFYRDAVAELVSADPRAASGSLKALSRKELVRPAGTDLPGEDAFRFLHVLLRDTAYAAIPKARRAELHERFARWLDKRAEAVGTDEDEFVGHHLEQAVRLRRALGPASAGLVGLAESAADRLAIAGRRLLVADPMSAASLYERAAALLDPLSPEAVDHLRRAAAARQEAGDLAGAAQRYDSAAASARATGDARRVLLCDTAYVVVRLHVEADPDSPAALLAVDRALERFEQDGDDEGTLIAGLARLELLNELATWGPMVELAERLLPVARRQQDLLSIGALERFLGAGLFLGPSPYTQALDRIDTSGDPRTRALDVGRTFSRAATLAHLDRADEARESLARGEALVADAATPAELGHAAFGGGMAGVQLDDLETAEFFLRRGVDALRAVGERSWVSSLLPTLGDVRLERGDPVEARTLAELGRELSTPRDAHSQAAWRALLARLEAADGDIENGTRLADEAVRWAETTDQTDTIAEVHVARAEVHERAGRFAESRADLDVALAAYQSKGSITGARRVRAQLTRLSGLG